MKKLLGLLVVVLAVLVVADAEAFRVTTADTGGADCELRESSATSNRGGSSEIASRIENREEQYWKKNSLIYLKFGVADITAEDLAGDITVRTTFRNNNQIKDNRISDDDGEDPQLADTGFDYFVLDPTADGANWDEMAITPSNAPGYYYDGDMGTKATYDFLGMVNSDLTYLGFNQFDRTSASDDYAYWEDSTNSFSVGAAFDFTLSAGSALHAAIVAAQATDHQTVTVIMGVNHGAVSPAEADPDWLGFNYLFNPKEMGTLNSDNESPWALYNSSNANNDYSPMLTNEPHVVPEPATMALLGFGGLALLRKRK